MSPDGKEATNLQMLLDRNAIDQDVKFDGFCAYGSYFDNDASLILKARSIHHEIEHLFRASKTFLDARQVYLSRANRNRSRFLIYVIAMTIIKILQKRINDSFPGYSETPLTIGSLINTLRDI